MSYLKQKIIFQFILWVYTAYCNPEIEIVIGDNVKFVLGHTPNGIISKANAQQLLENVENKPSYKNKKNCRLPFRLRCSPTILM